MSNEQLLLYVFSYRNNMTNISLRNWINFVHINSKWICCMLWNRFYCKFHLKMSNLEFYNRFIIIFSFYYSISFPKYSYLSKAKDFKYFSILTIFFWVTEWLCGCSFCKWTSQPCYEYGAGSCELPCTYTLFAFIFIFMWVCVYV